MKEKFKPFWVRRKGKLLIDDAHLSDYLVKQQYFLLNAMGAPIVIQLKNSIADTKSAQEVFNDILDFIKEQKDNYLRTCWMKQGENMLLKRKGILGSLPQLEIPRYRDSREEVRLFYKNKVVIVRSEGIRFESYRKFRKRGQFIFSEQIIPRDFDKRVNEKGDFEKFSRLVTDNKKHLLNFRTGLGYLISSFKNPSIAPAVIVSDIQSQVENEAHGRSGKGIFIKALSQMVDIAEYNGKATDLKNDKFVYQNVTVLTALMVLQDVSKGFVFESLFSSLTDTMSVERKYKNKTSIPFFESPKIALTTNYTIPQNTASYKDRKHLVMLNNFFNAENKPEKHFKKMLFDWNDDEWASFDCYMVNCVYLFLKKGLVKYSNKKIEYRQLVNQTSEEFVDLMESDFDLLNRFFSIKEVSRHLEVEAETESGRSKIVGNWINLYAAAKGLNVDKAKRGGITKIRFRP